MNVNGESRVRRLRKERNLSGIKVAERLNITPQYYYDIEKGERRLTTEIAGQLADILQTTTDYLLGKTNVNLYDFILTKDEEAEEEQKNKNSSPLENGKELNYAAIPIEDLVRHNLTHKGRALTEDQKQNLSKILQAAAEMLEEK